MPNDVVVDTNVLVHADNKKIERHHECIDFINYLLDSTELLCFDEGFVWHETHNKSHIAQEYWKHLRYGMLGFMLVSKLASSKRVVEKPLAVDQTARNLITQKVTNKRDRIFLKVAYNSDNKILISNDFADFDKRKRKLFKGKLGLQIMVPSGYEKIPPEIIVDEEE